LVSEVFAAEAIMVTYQKGEVFISSNREGPWKPLKKEMTIIVGNFVKTGKQGTVELKMPDDSTMRLAPNTLFSLNQSDFVKKKPRRFSSKLFFGKVWAKVSKTMGRLRGRGTFNTRTPTAVCGIRGTIYDLRVAANNSTDILVYEGKVGVGPALLVEGGPKEEMSWPGEVSEKKWEEIILGKLQRLHIGPDGKPGKPKSFDPAKETDEWTLWNRERDAIQ
jgi:hypothetical protein